MIVFCLVCNGVIECCYTKRVDAENHALCDEFRSSNRDVHIASVELFGMNEIIGFSVSQFIGSRNQR